MTIYDLYASVLPKVITAGDLPSTFIADIINNSDWTIDFGYEIYQTNVTVKIDVKQPETSNIYVDLYIDNQLTRCLVSSVAETNETSLYSALVAIPTEIIAVKLHSYSKPVAEKGATGEQGPIGPQGIQGPEGIQGPVGEQGPQGIAGERGEQGIQGEQGEQGPVGPQGAQGVTGEAGEKGAMGDQGEQGPQGPIGEQGPVGEKGPTGDKGEQGDKGPTGDKGEQGDKGEAGDTGYSIVITEEPALGATYKKGSLIYLDGLGLYIVNNDIDSYEPTKHSKYIVSVSDDLLNNYPTKEEMIAAISEALATLNQ